MQVFADKETQDEKSNESIGHLYSIFFLLQHPAIDDYGASQREKKTEHEDAIHGLHPFFNHILVDKAGFRYRGINHNTEFRILKIILPVGFKSGFPSMWMISPYD